MITAHAALFRVGFSSPAQASFFLVCTGDCMGAGYFPCVIPRPVEANQIEEDKKKRAILLSSVGAETYKVIKSLMMPKKPARNLLRKLQIC